MKFYIIFILGVIAFLFLPFGIDRFFMNKFVTNWDMGQWAGFLGSYLGGAIGGVIAIGGIWWQLKKEEKKSKKDKLTGLLNYLYYNMESNIKMLSNDYKKKSFLVFSYGINSWSVEGDYRYLEPLNQEVLNNYLITVFELSISKDIMELNSEILRFNTCYEYLFKNLNVKKDLLKSFENNGEVDVVRELSFITYKWALNNVEAIQRNIENLKELKETVSNAKIKNEIEKLIEIDFYDNNNDEENIKKIVSLIINLIGKIWVDEQRKTKYDEEKTQKLLNFRSKDDDLYRLDIYKISEKIKNLKEKLEEELEKLKK